MKLFIRLSGKEINKCLFKSSIFSSLFSRRWSYLVWGQVGWSDLWILTGKKSSKSNRSCMYWGSWSSPEALALGTIKCLSVHIGTEERGLLGGCFGWNTQILPYVQVGSGPFILITKWSLFFLAYHWNIFNFCPLLFVLITITLIQVLICSLFHSHLPLSLTGFTP